MAPTLGGVVKLPETDQHSFVDLMDPGTDDTGDKSLWGTADPTTWSSSSGPSPRPR